MVAQRLRSVVRTTDTVARLGGDEFAVLLTGVAELTTAHNVANRTTALLRQPVHLTEQAVNVSVSIAIALSTPTSTAQDLLSEADAAMYEAMSTVRWN